MRAITENADEVQPQRIKVVLQSVSCEIVIGIMVRIVYGQMLRKDFLQLLLAKLKI